MKTHLLLAKMVSCVSLYFGPLHGEDSVKIEPPWTDAANGWINKGEYIDLNLAGKDRLFFQYCAISDSGVQLERAKEGGVLWRKHVQPLGVMHSKYKHRVEVRIWKDTIYIESRGSMGLIYETRNLSDGNLIKREIRETKNPIDTFLLQEIIATESEHVGRGEQAGAGQSATKPAEKAPEKDQPTPPESKDGHR
jgi:hypothetical protein